MRVLSSGPMLDTLRRRISRAVLPLSLALVTAFALSTSGCLALISGIQNTTLTFPLDQKPNGTFWAWNEIEIDQDISSIESATLVSVTLKVTLPAGQSFGFLRSLKGEVVGAAGERTLMATLDNINPSEQAIVLDIQYSGDLRPLMRDGKTIRIEWTGTTNTAFAWPQGGFTIEANVQINIE